MKNACIILKKKVSISDVGASRVLDAFFSAGYAFDEVRIVLQDDEKRIHESVAEFKKCAENILLLADKTALPIAKRYISALFPENTMQNSFGDAGVYAEKGCSLMLLSADETETGVGFVQNVCVAYLQKKSGVHCETLTLRCVGVSESRMDALLAQARNICGNSIQFFRTRKYDEEILQILYDNTVSKMLSDNVVRVFMEGLSDTVYAVNDVSLEEQLVNALKVRHKTISVAESFTGGGIAKRITSVSGASEVYFEGLNTYNERSKIQRLGVSEYTLKTQGAVSDQTAYEMACGLLSSGNCDLAIATTGIAGPKSDRSMLPVGLCYIAVGTKERIRVYRYVFDGDRKEIAEKAINYALFFAYKQLKDL